jgi:hypothetical protein
VVVERFVILRQARIKCYPWRRPIRFFTVIVGGVVEIVQIVVADHQVEVSERVDSAL